MSKEFDFPDQFFFVQIISKKTKQLSNENKILLLLNKCWNKKGGIKFFKNYSKIYTDPPQYLNIAATDWQITTLPQFSENCIAILLSMLLQASIPWKGFSIKLYSRNKFKTIEKKKCFVFFIFLLLFGGKLNIKRMLYARS